MTERAERAAKVLMGHGWSLDETYSRKCSHCSADVAHGFMVCPQCGTKRDLTPSSGSLAELEAAIKAANQE